MIGRCLARVVSQTSLLGHHRVHAGGKHQAGRQALSLKYLVRLIRHHIRTSHIDGKGLRPLLIGNPSFKVGGNKDSRRHHDSIDSAVGIDRLPQHLRHAFSIDDVGPQTNRRTATGNPRPGDADSLAQLFHQLGGSFLSRFFI